MRDVLVVKNGEGIAVAEINTKTGHIEILDNLYEQRVIPMTPPSMPTRIGIFFKADLSIDNPLTYVYFVPDVNTDAVIDGADIIYDSKALNSMNGVHIKPLVSLRGNSGFNFTILPADDEHMPGAAIIEKDKQKIATIDVNGNILFSDPLVMMKVKEAEKQNDPVVFEMFYDAKLIAEIFIAAHLQNSDEVIIVDAPETSADTKPTPLNGLKSAKRLTSAIYRYRDE